MKKTKFLMLAFALLTFTMMGCSLLGGAAEEEKKKEEEEKKKDIKYETFVGTSYRDSTTKMLGSKEFKIVKFGDWPQSIKEDNVKIDESTGAKAGAYTYFKGSDGEWYCKCKEYAALGNYDNSLKYSDGSKVGAGGESSKWFKVEPIQWIVWETENNKSLLVPLKVLINCSFYDYEVDRTIDGKTVYPNNYDHSRVRAYLNGLSYQKLDKADGSPTTVSFEGKGFLQTAFTEALRASIETTDVVNDLLSANDWTSIDPSHPHLVDNDYVTGTTLKDKIFLPSRYELTKNGYLRNNKYKPVDFALANGVIYSSETAYKGLSDWWTRTPDDNNKNNVLEVLTTGGFGTWSGIITTQGIVPALWVKN